MCKLFAITNTSKIKPKQLEKITKSVENTMSYEKDGLGITVLHKDGSIAGRKYLKTQAASVLNKPDTTSPISKPHSLELGEFNANAIQSMIIHGRTSTNSVSLTNTHPIVKHGLWLSHNGVVEDSGPKYNMTTSNDTEHIVERIATQGLEAIEKHISGYYACLYFKEHSKMLHVFRDSIAPLYIALVPKLETYIIATTEELIENACNAINVLSEVIEEVDDNVYFEVNGLDFNNIKQFEPKGRSAYSDSKAHLSLGKTFDFSPSEELIGSNELEFLVETETYSDDSWSFFLGHRSLTHFEFLQLGDDERLSCVVVRSDGTICSSDSKLNGLLYEGHSA